MACSSDAKTKLTNTSVYITGERDISVYSSPLFNGGKFSQTGNMARIQHGDHGGSFYV